MHRNVYISSFICMHHVQPDMFKATVTVAVSLVIAGLLFTEISESRKTASVGLTWSDLWDWELTAVFQKYRRYTFSPFFFFRKYILFMSSIISMSGSLTAKYCDFT